MNEEIRRIEAKIQKESSPEKPAYKCLTKEEGETYADYLASRGHFRSAILFTGDEAKKAKFEEQKKWKSI